MAEAEDVITDAARHATVFARDLWRRHARPAKADAPAERPVTPADLAAHTGLTEDEARREYGTRLTVLRFPYHENDRAQAEGKTAGLIKVMVVKGRPVGAGIAGAQAGELIGLWALALSSGLKMSAIVGMVAPYPTLGEVSKRAAGAYFSPKLFDSPMVKRVVGFVQHYLP